MFSVTLFIYIIQYIPFFFNSFLQSAPFYVYFLQNTVLYKAEKGVIIRICKLFVTVLQFLLNWCIMIGMIVFV